MYYEKTPRFRRLKLRVALAARPESGWLTSASKSTALNDDIFTLGGKIDVGTNELPPKEATHMSRDVKYIGMDVHKEAIVIGFHARGGERIFFLTSPFIG
jgi:hypothetical protein